MTAPSILIAGIGNLFLGDDAFGVEVAQRLLRRPWPDGVRVVDFGSACGFGLSNVQNAGQQLVANALTVVGETRVLAPLIRVLNGVANGVLRLMRVEPKDEVSSAFTAEEVQSIVEESQREGLLGHEHALVSGALEFSDRDAGDVAVPLGELVTVAAGSTPADVERLVARTGFSRFPVTDAGGGLTGYLHLKDVLYADDER